MTRSGRGGSARSNTKLIALWRTASTGRGVFPMPPDRSWDADPELRAEAEAEREQHNSQNTEPPRPLVRKSERANAYPVDALGDILGPAARDIHDRVQAPIAIGAQSVLGAAALVVQAHADVVLPIGPGQARPLSCYLMT